MYVCFTVTRPPMLPLAGHCSSPLRCSLYVRPTIFSPNERAGLCRGRCVGVPQPHDGLLTEGQAQRHHAPDGGGGEGAGKPDRRPDGHACLSLPFPSLPFPPLPFITQRKHCTRRTYQIDHDLDHLDHNLPLVDVAKDLYRTDSSQETCRRSCRLYGPHPAT